MTFWPFLALACAYRVCFQASTQAFAHQLQQPGRRADNIVTPFGDRRPTLCRCNSDTSTDGAFLQKRRISLLLGVKRSVLCLAICFQSRPVGAGLGKLRMRTQRPSQASLEGRCKLCMCSVNQRSDKQAKPHAVGPKV
ncbi:unnamed protein product [Effrenium voratum]|uniref:Secreted protein n=1 Tax=Effrenium voratum TaxID=2562239 RepID=A0AA36HLV7_9DINO|nr:unnamed protein product [Effrenium voratum]CAJ1418770.1 unnamed protein product [Effrenium voratum]CAJ1458486.1 unnamed protein product [Effrenium voratum]